MIFKFTHLPKFRQRCEPKCRTLPNNCKHAKIDTETNIWADTKTDNFLSLVFILFFIHSLICSFFLFLYTSLFLSSLWQIMYAATYRPKNVIWKVHIDQGTGGSLRKKLLK